MCSDTGTLVVEIWAYDGAGNSDFCETYILVQDNMNLCGPDSLSVGAAGAISTEEDLGSRECRSKPFWSRSERDFDHRC